jgi:cyclopropane fatty-acyl-phospholipid synthase-like methyltransferase
MTTNFYNNHATELIIKYDDANMSSLHTLLLQFLPKNAKVLDIGFGSGRDLAFLKKNNYEIWGIDASIKFVKNAKIRFFDIPTHFIQATLPIQTNNLPFQCKFDAVISIAMWMHLKKDEYADIIHNIVNLTTKKATIIISYSQGKRINDERYFEDVDLEYITHLFKQYNFTLIHHTSNSDSLNRETLKWVTVVFKHD